MNELSTEDLLIVEEEELIDQRRPSSSDDVPHGARFATPGRATCLSVVFGPRRAVASLSESANLDYPRIEELREVPYNSVPEDPRTIVSILQTMLCGDQTLAGDIRVALPATWFETTIIRVPPATPSDTGVLIERELKRKPWLEDKNVQWKVAPLGTDEGQMTYLVLATVRDRLEQLFREANRAGLKFRRVTSPQLAALELFRSRVGEGDGGTASALLHVDAPTVTLSLIHGQKLCQLRTLPFDASTLARGSSSGLLAELRRSALYFKQSSGGQTLKTVYLTGLSQERGDLLKAFLEEELDITAYRLDVPDFTWPGSKSPPPEQAGLIGLLRKEPDSVSQRLDFASNYSRLGNVFIYGGLGAFLVAVILTVLFVRGRIDQATAMVEAALGSMEAELVRAEEFLDARQKFEGEVQALVAQWEALVEQSEETVNPAGMVAVLCQKMPSSIQFDVLAVDPVEDESPWLSEDDGPTQPRVSVVIVGRAFGEPYRARRAIDRVTEEVGRIGKPIQTIRPVVTVVSEGESDLRPAFEFEIAATLEVSP